jgi:hypothetical protein
MLGAALAFALAFPVVASAQEGEAVATTATAPYELDFTLPSESRSGCLVCHGDPALIRVREGIITSFFISAETMAASTHVDQQCVGCHVDFTYKSPHLADQWSVTAKSACRNCHDEQSQAFGVGVHRPTVPSAQPVPVASTETPEAPKPLCGDCHGSHDIMALTETGGDDWRDGKAEIHDRGYEVCGRCHQDYWDSYADYYHGAAYKRGAEDAPSCWDCHGWHDILPSDDRGSRVNGAHLVETCGQEGCHFGVDETYVEYAAFIHGRPELEAANPLRAFFRTIAESIGRLFGGGGEA